VDGGGAGADRCAAAGGDPPALPLTTLLQVLIAAHALVLIVGGAWTYARVPFGFWLQDVLGLDRNPYDRIGHFMQGFVPAIAARESCCAGGCAGAAGCSFW
jgi:uncharacterized membrane protein YjdF